MARRPHLDLETFDSPRDAPADVTGDLLAHFFPSSLPGESSMDQEALPLRLPLLLCTRLLHGPLPFLSLLQLLVFLLPSPSRIPSLFPFCTPPAIGCIFILFSLIVSFPYSLSLPSHLPLLSLFLFLQDLLVTAAEIKPESYQSVVLCL